MSSASYLLNRRGYYHFRIRIPSDLSSAIPQKEIVKSLKTKEKGLARVAALSYQHGIFKTFSLLRTGFISGEQARRSLQSLLDGKIKSSSTIPLSTPSELEPAIPLEKKVLLSTVVNQFVHDRKHGWGLKTKMENEGSYRMIIDVLGDLDIKAIDRPTVRDLRDKLSKLPANVYKLYPGKSAWQVLEQMEKSSGKEGATPMSITSLNKHVSRFSTLMKYCIKEGYIKANPASGLKIKQKRRPDEERKAYSPEDVRKICRYLPVPSNRPERYWVPLIGLLSGLRLDEICSLYVEDVREVDGVWCFDINENHDKKVKTPSSIRLVPVHPRLISLGLIEYVKELQGEKVPRLWMNLGKRQADGYSNALGKWYQRFNRKHVTTDSLKTFHSLRHAFADTLKQKGVQEVLIAELMGHANGSITTGRYGKRYQPKVLLKAISILHYSTH